ncbi:hypothetical protein [Treponema putidum]|nr:hypothetical protein [Treponema putidum]
MININQESVKGLLLKLQPTDTDFTVIFSGKKSVLKNFKELMGGMNNERY